MATDANIVSKKDWAFKFYESIIIAIPRYSQDILGMNMSICCFLGIHINNILGFHTLITDHCYIEC